MTFKLSHCHRGHPLAGPGSDVRIKPDRRRECRRCERLTAARRRVEQRKRVPIELSHDPATLSTLSGIADVAPQLFPEVNEFFGWFGASAAPGDCVAAIVGESLRDDQPASTPPLFWGRTGGFLMRSLKAIRKDTHAMYFTNALKPGHSAAASVELLRDELLGFVVPDRVIALGEVASAQLTAAGVPHAGVPHPSWFLRFHYAARAEYRALLSGAWRLQREPNKVESQT